MKKTNSSPTLKKELRSYKTEFMAKQPKKLYMLTLSGQGDTEIKFIEQDSWDWIEALHSNWKAEPPPSVIEKKIAEFKRDEMDEGREQIEEFEKTGKITVHKTAYCYDYGIFHTTSGSGANDAALMCPCVYMAFSMKEALDYIKEENVDVQDTFEGAIY